MMAPARGEGLAPRTLYVVPIQSCARDTGGGQRTWHLAEALAWVCAVDLLLVWQGDAGGLEALYPRHFQQTFPMAEQLP